MLILRTLLFGAAHGHQPAKYIQRSTDHVLQVEHGSLYPALHRLERKRWLAAKWEAAVKNQKREFKYYRLMAAGRKQLARGIEMEADGERDCARDVACRGGLTCLWLWRRQRREQDLDRELRTHVELETEENLNGGVPSDETRYAAQRVASATFSRHPPVRRLFAH